MNGWNRGSLYFAESNFIKGPKRRDWPVTVCGIFGFEVVCVCVCRGSETLPWGGILRKEIVN